MANSYWSYMYGSFNPKIKEQNDTKYTSKEVERIKKQWNTAVDLLKSSGVDLSRVPLVKGEK